MITTRARSPAARPPRTDSTGKPGIPAPPPANVSTNVCPLLVGLIVELAELPVLERLTEYVPGGRVKLTVP